MNDEKEIIFDKVLEILQNPDNRVYISLVPPFDLSFEIEKNILKEALVKTNITEEQFQRQSDPISNVLLAILQKQEEEFVNAYVGHEYPSKVQDETEDEEKKKYKENLEQQLKKVRTNLYQINLQKRYDFKKSSKAPSFTNIDWDIKVKTQDSKLQNVRFPYTTCKLIFQRVFEYPPYYVLGGNALDTVQINFAVDDIDYVIRVLTNIKNRLEQIEEEVK